MPDSTDLAYLMAGSKRRNPFDAKRSFADKLLQSGADTSPVIHPLQGAGRLAQALVGGYLGNRADQDEQQASTAYQSKLAAAMAETDPVKQIGMLPPDIAGPAMAKLAIERQKQNASRAEAQEAASAFGNRSGGMPQASGGGGSPAPAMAPQEAGAEAQKKIQYLVNTHGFTPDQAAMAIGNLYQESKFNPGAVGDSGTAFGQGQWRLDRQDALRKNAAAAGEDPNNPTTQLDFFANEFKTRPEWQKFANAQTPQDQQNALMAYFAPAGYTPNNPQGGHAYGQRMQYGQQFAQQPGTPPTPSPSVVNGPTMLAQGSDMPRADGSGTPLPPGPQRAPEIARPEADPAMVQHLQGLIATRKITLSDAEKIINDDINRRWGHAQTQATEDRKTQLQIEAEKRKQQGELEKEAPRKLIQERTKAYEETVRPRAESAVSEINNMHQMRQLLDAGAFTGVGAEAQATGARFAQALGLNWGADTQANTAALQAAGAERVLSVIKSLGANPSNADRTYLEKAKAGGVEIGEAAMRRILEIGERSARSTLSQHEAEVARLRKLPGMDAIGGDYFGLPQALNYAEWTAANPPLGARGAAPPTAPGAAPPMQPNGIAPHPNPNAPTNMPQIPTVNSPQEAARLPKGTQFRTPDGRLKVVP